jgi:hypothetical protein
LAALGYDGSATWRLATTVRVIDSRDVQSDTHAVTVRVT